MIAHVMDTRTKMEKVGLNAIQSIHTMACLGAMLTKESVMTGKVPGNISGVRKLARVTDTKINLEMQQIKYLTDKICMFTFGLFVLFIDLLIKISH